MNRHEFLSGVHTAYQPRNYLEIGINDGRGLQLAKTRTIGVDPAFKITAEFECDLKMVKATSDDFFARADAISRFPEGVLDFAFIDGLHIFEFALRDFMNVERLSSPNSVVVFDDMLPRAVAEAARDRHTMFWTGDVFKVAAVLERYRPDLVVVPLDTKPTGLLLVLNLDPTNTILTEHYDEILAEFVVDDPQVVADDILNRRHAADPQQILDLAMWSELAAARDSGSERPTSVAAVRELRGTAVFVAQVPKFQPWPPAKPAKKPAPAAAPRPATHVSATSTTVRRARRLAGRVRRAIKRRL